MMTKNDIIQAFNNIGVNKGDILVIQSSYKGCGEIENGAIGLIEALQELLGEEGTLIMPAYNFDFWTKQHYFDILETPSEVGFITEVFRKSNNVARTSHPIHSLSVWGKLKETMVQMDYAGSFDKNSVFALLNELNAMYCTIGLGNKMPFLPCHFTEVEMNVPYRRVKDFAGIYLDINRIPSLRVYNFNVRVNHKNPVYEAHRYLMEQNFVKTYLQKNIPICFARAKDYHAFFVDYIKKFPQYFDL